MATVNINIFKMNISEEEIEEAGKSNNYYTHILNVNIRKMITVIIIIIIHLCNINQHNYCLILKKFNISVMTTKIHLFI